MGAQGLVDSPTREIALLVYTGGYRPGLVSSLLGKLPGPLATLVDVDDIELNIKANAPRVEASAKVTVFGNPQTLKTKGDLAASSAVRLRETVQEGDAFGQSFALPGPLNYKRDIIVTYLDDDLLVVRDETVCPITNWTLRAPCPSPPYRTEPLGILCARSLAMPPPPHPPSAPRGRASPTSGSAR
jgi:hypothetical protein